MATAQKSIGTTLKNVDDNVLISDLSSIGEFGVESDEIDVTSLDSPDNYKEFIAGAKDSGEVPFSGFIKSEANHEDMLELADAQTNKLWEVAFPQGAKAWFTAFVKSYKEGESTPDGVRTFSGALRISGKVTYSPTGVSA